jgi:hypothetical protein
MIEQAELTAIQQFEVLRALSRQVVMPSQLRIKGVNEFDFRDQERLRGFVDDCVRKGWVDPVYEEREVQHGATKERKELHVGFRLSLSGVFERQRLADQLGGIS